MAEVDVDVPLLLTPPHRLSLLLRRVDDAARRSPTAAGVVVTLDRVAAVAMRLTPLLPVAKLCRPWLELERGGRRTRPIDVVMTLIAGACAETGTTVAMLVAPPLLGRRLSTRGGGRMGTRTLHTDAVSSIRRPLSVLVLLPDASLLEQLETSAKPASLGVGDPPPPLFNRMLWCTEEPPASVSDSVSESESSQSASVPAASAKQAGACMEGDCRLRVLFEAMFTSL